MISIVIPDSNIFLYYEEVILSERFKKNNWGCLYCNSVEVLHYEGASSNSNSKDAILNQSKCYYYKNYLHYSTLLIFIFKISIIFRKLFK